MVSYAVLSSVGEPEKWHWFHQCSCTGYVFCYMSEIRRVVGSRAPVVGASVPQNINDSISEGFYREISFDTYGKGCVFSRYIIAIKVRILYSSPSSDLTLSLSRVFKWKYFLWLLNKCMRLYVNISGFLHFCSMFENLNKHWAVLSTWLFSPWSLSICIISQCKNFICHTEFVYWPCCVSLNKLLSFAEIMQF